MRHFHEKLREEHEIKLSYTWVQQALQGAGVGGQAAEARATSAPAAATTDDRHAVAH